MVIELDVFGRGELLSVYIICQFSFFYFLIVNWFNQILFVLFNVN